MVAASGSFLRLLVWLDMRSFHHTHSSFCQTGRALLRTGHDLVGTLFLLFWVTKVQQHQWNRNTWNCPCALVSHVLCCCQAVVCYSFEDHITSYLDIMKWYMMVRLVTTYSSSELIDRLYHGYLPTSVGFHIVFEPVVVRNNILSFGLSLENAVFILHL